MVGPFFANQLQSPHIAFVFDCPYNWCVALHTLYIKMLFCPVCCVSVSAWMQAGRYESVRSGYIRPRKLARSDRQGEWAQGENATYMLRCKEIWILCGCTDYRTEFGNVFVVQATGKYRGEHTDSPAQQQSIAKRGKSQDKKKSSSKRDRQIWTTNRWNPNRRHPITRGYVYWTGGGTSFDSAEW